MEMARILIARKEAERERQAAREKEGKVKFEPSIFAERERERERERESGREGEREGEADGQGKEE